MEDLEKIKLGDTTSNWVKKINDNFDDIENLKTSDIENDGDGTSPFATQSYVDTHGGKIDKIKVDGVKQSIINKEVDLSVYTKAISDNTFATKNQVNAIEGKIPSEASSINQLADKAFVASSISTSSSTFRGTVETLAELRALVGVINDYAFYKHTDSIGNVVFSRYKYTSVVSETTGNWTFEYDLNNSSFTQEQWNAINSGATSGLIGKITTNENAITTINITLSGYGDIVTHDTDEFATPSDIPTTLAELTGDATHRVVTDTEKATWNGKQDAISSYLKNASVSGNTLTITKNDDTTISFSRGSVELEVYIGTETDNTAPNTLKEGGLFYELYVPENQTLLTISTPGTYTLNLYKEDTQETKIYVNDVLSTTTTTSGSQDISVTTSANSVVKIQSDGDWYFDYCCLGDYENNSKLTNIDFTSESKMTSIGNSVFAYSSLTSINIPSSVSSIGNDIFLNCTNLMSLIVDSNNNYFKDDNNKALLSKDGTTLYIYADKVGTSYTIPSTVTTIRENSFMGSNLTSVTIPSSVGTIGTQAFKNCNYLTSISIPSSVTAIEQQTFYGCPSLATVTMGNNVTRIDTEAFYGSGLTTFTIPESVTNIKSNAFKNCSELTRLNVYSTSSATKITLNTKGWVNGCDETNLTIHASSSLDATTSQTAFGEYWNYIDANTMATTIYDL